MIKLTNGNLLNSAAQALVNTVNCDGYMGKGIALQFKQAFPNNYRKYHNACKRGDVQPGKMFVVEEQIETGIKIIINFPTKRNWREKSRLEDIESGLLDLAKVIQEKNIPSIAIPPLGCGLGGLKWEVVKPLIEKTFAELPEVEVFLFEPKGAPAAKDMIVRTKKKMTVARALFIQLIKKYKEFDYSLSLLEIQKLAYFLQEAGQPLRLRFEKHIYGPYAHNLNKVLEAMESHYTCGFGASQRPDTEIKLLPGAYEEADELLKGEPAETRDKLNKVAELIEGFETPYSMELLATVHWVVIHDKVDTKDEVAIIQAVHAWNQRKKDIFQSDHIKVARQQLIERGWI
jgi:O-acetyl-ADP-ribose deacetylase (regulator of RNase III)